VGAQVCSHRGREGWQGSATGEGRLGCGASVPRGWSRDPGVRCLQAVVRVPGVRWLQERAGAPGVQCLQERGRGPRGARAAGAGDGPWAPEAQGQAQGVGARGAGGGEGGCGGCARAARGGGVRWVCPGRGLGVWRLGCRGRCGRGGSGRLRAGAFPERAWGLGRVVCHRCQRASWRVPALGTPAWRPACPWRPRSMPGHLLPRAPAGTPAQSDRHLGPRVGEPLLCPVPWLQGGGPQVCLVPWLQGRGPQVCRVPWPQGLGQMWVPGLGPRPGPWNLGPWSLVVPVGLGQGLGRGQGLGLQGHAAGAVAQRHRVKEGTWLQRAYEHRGTRKQRVQGHRCAVLSAQCAVLRAQ